MRNAGRKTPESLGWYALAGFLLLGGPVWHYLYVHHYPFSRFEAYALPLGAGLIGALAAMLAHRVGGLVATVGFAVLLYLFVDLQFNHEESLRTVLVLAGCLGLSLLVRQRRALLTVLMLGAFNLASLPRAPRGTAFDRSERQPGAADSLPVVLHLILDEQWGVGGLRAAGDSATADFLTDFYYRRGFEIYEGAYSRWNSTRGSIPEMLSLGRSLEIISAADSLSGYHVPVIPYFEKLHGQGYALRVYQSTHLDFCHPERVTLQICDTWYGNSIANIGYLQGPWLRRAALASKYFLALTSYTYGRLRPESEVGWRRSAVGAGLAALERARRDLANSRGSIAIFLHSLAPHQPLEAQADCAPQADSVPRYFYGARGEGWEAKLRTGLGHYGAQVRCTHLVIAELLDALDVAVGRDNAIVIVHGDHGSRITPIALSGPIALSRLEPAQLNAMFSTLLAIRRPGVAATIHTEAVPLQDFFWDLVRQDFGGNVTGPWAHYLRERTRPSSPDRLDTLRVLTGPDMLWARPSP